MKRVLVLNQYFPPDTAATAKMVAALVEFLSRHFKVTVLAGRPSYNPTERHPFYLWRREKHHVVMVERVGSTTLPRHRMRWRLSNYLSYLALALPRALTIPTDVLIAMTDPPIVCLIGAIVAALRKCPFIYNIRDLHPDMAIAAGLISSGPLTECWEKLHRWVMKRANWVVVLGEDMKERVKAKGVPQEKIVIIRDGVPIPHKLPPSDHPLVREIRCGFNFVAMHAGNIGFYGAWETLILATRELGDRNFGLIFVGDGAFKERLVQIASANNIPNIRFLPFRPKEEVPFVLISPDIHIVTLRKGMEGLVVPSKLYPILAMGKPVLVVASEESDAARIVKRTGCGLVADPDSPSSVADVLRWAKRNKGVLWEMGQRAREIALEFSEEVQFQKFVHLILDSAK
ncbi:MAG: glycosyltransferase family 4 protein [Candidatus Bathyarchaeia archaeon]